MDMKSLEMPKSSMKDMAVKPTEMDTPKYPYGSKVYLDHDMIKALGLDKMPEHGQKVRLEAMGHVTGVHTDEGQDGPRHRMEIQMTHMGVKAKGDKPEDKLYDTD